MKPDSTLYNPDPDYLQGLLVQAFPALPLSKRYEAAATALGITPRSLQAYVDAREAVSSRDIPYAAQYALECLARGEEICPVCKAQLTQQIEGENP